MVSAERHDLPVYTLADLPPRARHVLLAPAVRWRVVVEQVVEIEHDVILDTVSGSALPARPLRPASPTCSSFRRIWFAICLLRRQREACR